MSDPPEEEEEEGFWLQLVSECRDASSKLPQGRRLLVLGDDDAEKGRLVDRMDGGGPCRTGGNGLAYRHLSVRDEYRENQARLGVWLLDGEPFYRPLLRYALDADSLPDTTALVVASMSRPWDILDAVRSWTQVLRDHIEGSVPPEELERRKAAVLERYREYVEPGLSIYGSLAADNTREIEENLGLELIVVVTGTERMRELQSEWGYEEEHFDFIQLALRDFCLRRGAALFYVSAREDRNCDLLLKYVLHRTHGLPFRLPGVLVERDALLVPAGWDTRAKVRFAADALPTIPPATPYADVVFRPARMADGRGPAAQVFAQGDQEFLADVASALERPGPELADAAREGGSSTTTTTTTATVVQRNVARRMARGGSPQKKRVAEGADTTLSNFFHSLLTRRTSTPSDRPMGMSGARTSAADSERQTDKSKFATSVHLSLDQQQQLPEYFLSNPVCPADCSFRTDSSLDLEEPFSPPLDRVRSSFNPPLRTLMERPDTLLANREETRRNERTDKEHSDRDETKSTDRTDSEIRSKELTNGETTKNRERPEEETRSNERTDKEHSERETKSTDRTDSESRSKELTNGETTESKELTNGETTKSTERPEEETRSKEGPDKRVFSKERVHAEARSNTYGENQSRDVGKNEETDGLNLQTNTKSETRVLRHALANPSAGTNPKL